MSRCSFGLLITLLLLIVFVLICVGTAGPQFTDFIPSGEHRFERTIFQGEDCKMQFFLYYGRLVCSEHPAIRFDFSKRDYIAVPSNTAGYQDYDFNFSCSRERSVRKLTAAYAFALLSCIFAFLALIMTIVTSLMPRIPSGISVALVIMTFVFLTVAWALSLTVLSMEKLCPASRPNNGGAGDRKRDYTIDWGLALVISAWCLTFVAVILVIIFACTRRATIVKKAEVGEVEIHTIHCSTAPQVPVLYLG